MLSDYVRILKGMDTITLNAKQQRRADILARTLGGSLTKEEAISLLHCSLRHLRRLLHSYQEKKLASVVHGNHSRIPVNKTDSETLHTIIKLAGEGGKYHDFNTSHLCYLLKRDESITIARSTLDRLLKVNNTRKPNRHRARQVFRHRQRSSSEGGMLQVDGSSHDWLEGRAPKMCLMGAIDDATSKLVYGCFHHTESQAGYLMMLREISKTHGLPESIYHDAHTILRSPKKATLEDELAGREPQSQVQRVMSELGIESICAHSPQAKGRVERVWQTLQDRLIKEMRLAEINTMEAANDFLKGFIVEHNTLFSLQPAVVQNAWVPIEADMDMNYYYSTKETRTVKMDHTIHFYGKLYQILRKKGQSSLAGKTVTVHVVPEGETYVYQDKSCLSYRMLEPSMPKNIKNQPVDKDDPMANAPQIVCERKKKKTNSKQRAWAYDGLNP